MATYVPSPGIFKGADAELDLEATLEMFTDYLAKMDKVFRLSRPLNPVTGNKVEWDDKDKKAMLEVEGREEMRCRTSSGTSARCWRKTRTCRRWRRSRLPFKEEETEQVQCSKSSMSMLK